MTSQSPALVVRDEGDHFHFLNTLYTAKVNSEETNNILTAMEFLAPKNFGLPLPPPTATAAGARTAAASAAHLRVDRLDSIVESSDRGDGERGEFQQLGIVVRRRGEAEHGADLPKGAKQAQCQRTRLGWPAGEGILERPVDSIRQRAHHVLVVDPEAVRGQQAEPSARLMTTPPSGALHT